MKQLICCLVALILTAAAGNALAVSTNWTGASSTSWNDAGNWSGTVPDATLEARIDNAGVPNYLTIAAGDNAQCERLTLRSSGIAYMTGGSLTMNGVSGRWRIGWRVNDDSYFTVTGGTITTNYTLQIADDTGATGALIFGGAIATIGRAIDVGDVSGGVASFTMNSGEFTASTLGDYGSQVGTAGTLNMNGGVLNLQASLTVRDGGVVNLGGGLLEATSLGLSATGSMDITAGMLELAGDASGTVDGYISSGQLTGYGSPGNVQYYWDGNTTSVWAIPEPATIVLLGLGGLFLMRRRK